MLMTAKTAIKFQSRSGVKICKMDKLETERNPFWRLAILLVVSGLAFAVNYPLVKFFQFFTGCSESTSKWVIGRNKWHRSSPFFDLMGGLSHEVKVKAASQEALDIFYRAPAIISALRWWKPQDFLDKVWLGMDNSRAVRNRCIILTRRIAEEIVLLNGECGEVRGVSMACGSAKSMVDAILLARAMSSIPLKIKLLLIDKSSDALDSARRRVKAAGLENDFIFVRGTTGDLEVLVRKHLKWINFAEMAGFSDYVPFEKLVDLFGSFRKILNSGGVFITCNICPNPEKPFMDWTVLWEMIYRTKNEFSDILRLANFYDRDVFHEPLRVHVIAVCRA